MDILNLKNEDIDEMGVVEYLLAVNYCWNAYTQRRNDFWTVKLIKSLASMYGIEWNTNTPSDNESKMNFDFSSINPVEQELKRQRRIPKKFLDEVNK